MKRIERPLVAEIKKALRTSPLIQVVVGPRQVGKTTALQQVLKRWLGPTLYASADLPSPPDAYWIQSQWQAARAAARENKGTAKTLLVLDEVQKVARWGEVVKACADEDRHHGDKILPVLLGSSSLQVQQGARESLAGRFELHYCSHWTLPECEGAFGWSLDQWIYFGGYPGAARFAHSPARWSRFISESLIEAVLSKDVLQLTHVTKPALLRQLFMLAAHSPAQILSYNKMLGQLQDAGNTVTLAHYLHLFASAYLISGLTMYSAGVARHRAASPKLVIWNNALVNALAGIDFRQARERHDYWGRIVENAVGGHLLNQYSQRDIYYWREGDYEVDYVIEKGREVLAIEVKSGRAGRQSGMEAFLKRHPKARPLIVGTGGIPLERFFSTDPKVWF